uniref:Uncharacterized protein n=1 Tax=Arundo donax TaxID=35708 RepID=A0A0A9GET4_ARUDO
MWQWQISPVPRW